MSRHRNRISTAVLSLAVAGGCTPEAAQYIHFPNLFHPGTATKQRVGAVVHDPYPMDDVGPPVVGGRPPGYERPVPEVDRTNMYLQRGSLPPRAMPVAPAASLPPPVTVPYPPTAMYPTGVPYPASGPDPVTSTPYPTAPPPVISTPYATGVPSVASPSSTAAVPAASPVTPTPQVSPFQYQQRSPY